MDLNSPLVSIRITINILYDIVYRVSYVSYTISDLRVLLFSREYCLHITDFFVLREWLSIERNAKHAGCGF